MRKLLMVIGEIIFVFVLFAIPIVTGISFVLQYDAFIKLLLVVGTGIEVFTLFLFIYFRVIDEDNQ